VKMDRAQMASAFPPKPKYYAVVLERERKLSLENLLANGLMTPGTWGGKMKVRFAQVGAPFQARRETGWLAVRVTTAPGNVSSTLLFEAHEGGRVSGYVRLK